MNKQPSARADAEKKVSFHRRNSRPQRHDEILAAAFEEFAARGYAEARVDDVARRAGIAKGTIYLYFRNKELLFRGVLRGLIRHVFEDFETFVRTFPGSAESLVRDVLLRQYNEIVKNPKARSMFRLLISESHKFPELSGIYLREVIAPSMTAMRLLVEKGIASGEFRETKIVEFPQVLVGPAILAVVWTLILGEKRHLDLDAYKEAHLDLLLHGLRKAGSLTGHDSPSTGGEQQ